MRFKILASVLVLSSTLLTACETMTSSNRVIVSSAEKWAILPIVNLSKTPLAGNRASTLVETHLRARGITELEVYRPTSSESVIALLDEAGELEKAKSWATKNGFRYGVTGNVQEWQYKNGLDNEPSIGVTLKFVDLQTDEVMWIASGSRTGWGYSNLSRTASKTIDELLSQVKFNADVRGRPVMAAAVSGSTSETMSAPSGNRITAPIRPTTINQP